jgi:hypothetical protein
MKRTLSLFLAATLFGCQAKSAQVFPVDCPAEDLEAAKLISQHDRPRPAGLFIPQLPVPSDVENRRAIIRLVVDANGLPVQDSIRVCGIPNQDYARRIVKAVAELKFVPASMQTSQLAGPTILIVKF